MQTIKECWDEELSPSDSLAILDRLACSHTDQGGEQGRKIRVLIDARDYRSLVMYKLDLNAPDWDPLQLIHCRQALGFYQKSEWLDIGVDKEAVALETFIAAEAVCREVNDLLRSVRLGATSVSLTPSVTRLLDAAGRKVRRVMGPCPRIEDLHLRFGPGATTAIKRKDSCAMNKFASGFQCSSGLAASGLLPSVLRQMPHWVQAVWDPIAESRIEITLDDQGEVSEAWTVDDVLVSVVPGRLEFVPKSAKTHRSIVVEPILTGMLQGGICRHLKRRLRLAGLDITDQSRNADLARQGSITGKLATLDLSSASDLISYELVRRLVSDEWWQLLVAARTGSCLYKGETILLQKFSSMGSGVTFPLETLIFWAISTSAIKFAYSDDEVGVYGDDIVVPAASAPDVLWALRVCGFSVNMEKSYWSGPFRESCGSDYYRGISNRPYYQQHLVSGPSLFTLHNFYFRSGDMGRAESVRALIPDSLRLYGPDGYGDGHLLSEEWPRIRKTKWIEKGFRGHAFETFSLMGLTIASRFPGDYVSPLYTVYATDRAPLVDPAILSAQAHRLLTRKDLRGKLHGTLTEASATEFTGSGRPLWVVPDTSGYKRTLIYTFAV